MTSLRLIQFIPGSKGAAALYSDEYFNLCKERLTENGVVTQWVPLYESSEAAVKSEIATFFKVFEEGTVWSNDDDGEGYDIVLLGQAQPTKIDVAAANERLALQDHSDVLQSMRDVGFHSFASLLATYAGSSNDLKPWMSDAEINRDANLRLQYLAGMGLNSYDEVSIYDAMVEHRTFPEELFVSMGSAEDRIRAAFSGETASANDE